VRPRLGLTATLLLALTGTTHAADPSTLWHIVNERCVPNQEKSGDPAPCTKVDLSQGRERGWVVLKDINGVAQFLVMPTARIHGMESPEIQQHGAPNYWEPAWDARTYVQDRLHQTLPRDDISMAINSIHGRSQDQLHIHVDCIAPAVKAALTEHQAAIGSHWAPLPVTLAGHEYRAMRLQQPTLAGADPFLLLADSDPSVAADMANHTLVVVGATFPGDVPGFVLLDYHADGASGEELQDHGCAIAHAP
jgi:CDP-diacylglycerol pyrophosphatase